MLRSELDATWHGMLEITTTVSRPLPAKIEIVDRAVAEILRRKTPGEKGTYGFRVAPAGAAACRRRRPVATPGLAAGRNPGRGGAEVAAWNKLTRNDHVPTLNQPLESQESGADRRFQVAPKGDAAGQSRAKRPPGRLSRELN